MENNIQTNEKVEKPKKNTSGSLVVMVLILSVIFSSAFGAVFGFMAGTIGQKGINGKLGSLFNYPASNISNESIKERIVQEDSAVIGVVEKATPGVVSIVISKDVSRARSFSSDPFGFPFFSDPFGNGQDSLSGGTEKQKIGGGSGFIVTTDGMIVTNKHVVSDDSAQYTVITNDGQEHVAKILARDPINDIAIIKIDGNDYSTLNFGDASQLKIGQTVIAIGYSLGEFTNSVSRGIISGLKRNLTAGSGYGDAERLTNIIQTDAAINPGNSGGPLLDIEGNVIGINVAMAQGAQNIGFAIPSDQIRKITDQVKTTGKISVPYIGVRYVPVDAALQKENGLPFDYGVLVVRGQNLTDFAVIPGSPADKAGIMENDIILEINGLKIDSNNNLADLIGKAGVGDTISLKIWHKGENKDISVKLEERK